MTRFWRLLLIALAFLSMGAKDLPRPCLGDGLGNACAINRCQCTELCSCRSVCGQEASEASEAGPSCHMHAAAGSEAAPAHFSLPEPQPPALLLSPPHVPALMGLTDGWAFVPAPLPSPTLNPPVPPPRIRA
jgi:hypothetical protein